MAQQLKRFENKVVVVTGGSRGIGLAIAERFAQEGAKVCVSANEKSVHDAAARLRESGFDALSVETDVTDKAQVVALYEEVASKPAKWTCRCRTRGHHHRQVAGPD